MGLSGQLWTWRLTTEVMYRFPDRLAGHFDRKVHLVIDGHSAHRSRKVRDRLAAHPDDGCTSCPRTRPG
ncbi:hypothetical protein [Streptomyces termitum]|uniref:hypothetical protein n=1 Tax=Streptomyces termitum TaxID=67368 RepID=UPI0037A9F673